ncbi:MAG: serine/threonine protein kinase [Deltaproteobacteria bacterium]|nr:serine/threonine protein kinase [Deltaproteobacteria bacterium]
MGALAEQTTRRIGRYEVLGELGHGGMAVVYRARDPRLEREVAIKVLHPHLARDAESRARFEREARAAARLRHPNIVEVYEFSAHGDPDRDAVDESFLVTELLEGPTLRQHLDTHGPMPAEVAAAVGIVLCDALACAHRQGVIHRDVKPDNLMLSGGTLKLTDFGIAHVVDAREMTATGQVLGSPAHMAPEQIESGTVDARTDLFAAGTVLYLLAVGRLPFEGATAHALLHKILEGAYQDPCRVRPEVGERFAAIVRRALQRDPAARHASAEALRDELSALVSEVGWEPPDRELRAYFQNPSGNREALTDHLRNVLPELGARALDRGEVPVAMGYFNRALALSPGDPKVLALVRSVARRRRRDRWLRGGGVVLAAAGLTATVVLTFAQTHPHHRTQPHTRPPVTLAQPNSAPEPVVVVPPSTPPSMPPGPPTPRTLMALVDAAVVPPTPSPPRVRPGGWRPTPAGPAGPAAPAGPTVVATRLVNFVPTPRSVQYSVDGSPLRTWSQVNASLGQLTVGTHQLVLEPAAESPGFQRTAFTVTIPPGDGPYTLRRSARTSSSQEHGLVSAQDASQPHL